MEEVSQTTSEIQSEKQPEQIAPRNLQSHKKLFVLLGLLFAIAIMIVGIGGYYLGGLDKSPSVNNDEEIDLVNEVRQDKEVDIVSPTPIVITSETSKDWMIKEGQFCSVKVPVPPKKPPYYILDGADGGSIDEGGYWVFEEVSNKSSTNMFTQSAKVTFTNPSLPGSGYVAAQVYISCNDNKEKLNSEELVDAYINKYIEPAEDVKVVKMESESLWGQDVIALYTEGGRRDDLNPQYFFANENAQYEVSRVTMSTNSSIKNTTEEIFNKLEFEN